MAQRIERGRYELELSEHSIGTLRREAAEYPADDQDQQQRQEQADRGRHDDCGAGLEHAAPYDSAQARLCRACAQQAPDQRVAAGRGYAKAPGYEVPGYGTHQRAEDHLGVNDVSIHNAFADGFRDVQPKE